MKNKIFSLLSLAILTLLVLTSFASATVTLSATTPATLSQSSGSFTIDVTSDTPETVDLTANTITDSSGNTITFTSPATITFTALTINVPQTINVPYTIAPEFNFEMKQYTSTLTADGTVSANITSTLTFAQTDFCAWDGNALTSTTADLEVSIEDIQVTSGFGEDTEWYPEDEVEVEIKVENKNNDYKIDNIVLEWGLFNRETGEWTIEVTDEDDFDLDDGEDTTLTLKFQLTDLDEDLEDLANGDFVLYLRATGEVDDDDAGEYDVCASASDDVSITAEGEFLILSNIQLPEANPCGSQVQVTADVLNIGDEDQEDVYVVLSNKELGISQKITLGDVDAFDNAEIDALLSVPQNAEEKTYTLELSVYNEDGELFENDNDDYSKFTIPLKVEGSCSNLPLASVSANLESETPVKAGQELVIKATIANIGSVKKTFGIELNGYEEWATLVSLDKTTLDLNSKATADVLITLKVNAGVSGEQTFNVIVKDGTKVLSQPITATVEKSSIFSGLTGLVTGGKGNNWYLWGIGALNLVLVLVIIFVAIKVIKKKK